MSYARPAVGGLSELRLRLVEQLRQRLRNGELTEAGLARLTGISQPHMHNVLKGVRVLSLESADLVLHRLQMSILDLFTREELSLRLGDESTAMVRVPLMQGTLGPGSPWPLAGDQQYAVEASRLKGVHDPLAVRLGRDPLAPTWSPVGGVAILDESLSSRTYFSFDALYAVEWHGQGVIRRIRRRGRSLFLLSEGIYGTACSEECEVSDADLPAVVRARVHIVLPPQ